MLLLLLYAGRSRLPAFYELQPSKIADSPEENDKERDKDEAIWHILKDILARQIICAHIQS
jgi:hypothetical protein